MDFWNKFNIKPVVCDLVDEEKQSPINPQHELSTEDAIRLQNILKSMPFAVDGVLSKTHVTEHRINTSAAEPIK